MEFYGDALGRRPNHGRQVVRQRRPFVLEEAVDLRGVVRPDGVT